MRKRSSYRPKRVIQNTAAYLIGMMGPVAGTTHLTDIKIKTALAMQALAKGAATRQDMKTLTDMVNMAEALKHLGFGKEYETLCIDGRYAILAMWDRSKRIGGRFVPGSGELRMLQEVQELHDAQMDVITVRDMARAMEHIDRTLRDPKHTISVPKFMATGELVCQ